MIPFKHVTSHHTAVLFLLLLPSALSVSYYGLGNEDGGLLGSSATAMLEDNAVVVRRSAKSFMASWPKWHPARISPSVSGKHCLPYHPVVRFRSPKLDYEYPTLKYPRRFEERFKNEANAGEILALLNNVVIERAFQGRLKGLRFGMSK